MLATQSLATIKNRIAEQSIGRAIYVDSTPNILLGNTGNKFFFRSTERDTLDAVERLMSHARQGVMSAVQLKPPSQLGVGECYYVLADGTAGRGRIVVGQPITDTTLRDCVGIRMIGHVTMKSALAAQDALMDAATVQFARNIKIELDVCGGTNQAVRYLIGILSRARSTKISIATTGLASVSGGGALLLSLGDVGRRSAHEDCRLHYRSSVDDLLSSETGARNKGISLLVEWETAESWGNSLAKHVFGEDGYSSGSLMIDFSRREIAELSLGYSGRCTFDVHSYPDLYRRLCSIDRPIRPSQAKLMGLLDYICY